MGEPEVSVLMSCYNASRWLGEAVESVLMQTFEGFEFILVDDGSNDETWRIIQNCCARDRRIVAIQKPNSGLADSLNVGISHARGGWIARLDADDLCEPIRLEAQVRFVQKHPEIVLLGTEYTEIDEDGHAVKRNRYPSCHRALVRHLERRMRFFPHSSAFYRADIARQLGGYNPRIRRSEDTRLWLELSMQGKLACLPEALVRIRQHASQVSHEGGGKRQFIDSTAATVCHYLQRAGHSDPSKTVHEPDWSAFLKWIEDRVEEHGAFERREAWAAARAAYFSIADKPRRMWRFASCLLQSGYVGALLWEKAFGSSLPKRLARKWMRRSGVR